MNILALAGDAGGARAVAPVIRALRGRGHHVACQAYAAATEIWRTEGLEPQPVALDALAYCDRLVLGTTVGATNWEAEAIVCAQALGKPTTSVLDFWSNYRPRYVTASGQFVLPDAIAVMDEAAREAMLGEGFPAERIHVTGQPAFDPLARYGIAPPLDRDPQRILYVSQPLSQLYDRETLGFHEREALRDVVQTLATILDERDHTLTLSIKLHPRELATFPGLPDSPSPRLVLERLDDAAADPRQTVLESDGVIGIHSILLLEACYLGRAVISYQPGLRIADPLPSNRAGWSCAVYAQADLREVLEREFFDPAARAARSQRLAEIPRLFDAARRVADIVESLEGPSHV